eukprot:13289544-Alexandrium_andersonii.AAC.1
MDRGSRRPPLDDLGELRAGDEARRRQAPEAGVRLRGNAPDSGGGAGASSASRRQSSRPPTGCRAASC